MKNLLLTTALIIFSAFANAYDPASFTKKCSADFESKMATHVIRGPLTSQEPGARLWNIPKMRSELLLLAKDAESSANYDCLSTMYKAAIDEATQYWAERGTNEDCIVEKQIPESRPEACNEKTWATLKSSFNYLRSIINEQKEIVDNSLKAVRKAEGQGPDCDNCEVLALAKKAEAQAAPAEALCCQKMQAFNPKIDANQCKALQQDFPEEGADFVGKMVNGCVGSIAEQLLKSVIAVPTMIYDIFTEGFSSGAASFANEMMMNPAETSQRVIQTLLKMYVPDVDYYNCLGRGPKEIYGCELTGNILGALGTGKILKVIISAGRKQLPKMGALVTDQTKAAAASALEKVAKITAPVTAAGGAAVGKMKDLAAMPAALTDGLKANLAKVRAATPEVKKLNKDIAKQQDEITKLHETRKASEGIRESQMLDSVALDRQIMAREADLARAQSNLAAAVKKSAPPQTKEQIREAARQAREAKIKAYRDADKSR